VKTHLFVFTKLDVDLDTTPKAGKYLFGGWIKHKVKVTVENNGKYDAKKPFTVKFLVPDHEHIEFVTESEMEVEALATGEYMELEFKYKFTSRTIREEELEFGVEVLYDGVVSSSEEFIVVPH